MRNRAKRKRNVPYIFGNDRLDELLLQLLDERDPRLRAYVYRLIGEQKVFPAIFIGEPFSDMFSWLRDEHGGGKFHIIIRRAKTMELSGILCIGVPLARRTF